MDRSTTPKVSQLPQSRGPKNRSRSGSEELNQILAQGSAAKASLPNALSIQTSVSASSSSSSGVFNSITPSPADTVVRSNSPGLLTWVRNTLLSGPGVRSSNIGSLVTSNLSSPSTKADDDGKEEALHRSEATQASGGVTPMPERLSIIKDEDAKLIGSARSSFSLEAPSNRDTLDPDKYQRRLSSISSTSTMFDDESSSESEEENVYAPFTHIEMETSLIRPTPRRKGNSLELADREPKQGDEMKAVPLAMPHISALDKNDSALESETSREGRGALSVKEAQESHQSVEDRTPNLRSMPSVVLTPPDSFSDTVHMSPLAGWVVQPAVLSADEKIVRQFNSGKMDVDSRRSNPAFDPGASYDSSDASFQSAETSEQGERRTLSTGSLTGDGEDLDDFLGRPKSPEEVAKNRPSKESVVLGSRVFGTRSRSESRRATLVKAKPEHKESEVSRPETPKVSLSTKETANETADSMNSPLYADTVELPSNSVIVTASPQPKRAMNFFGRRMRTASETMTSPEEEVAAVEPKGRRDGNFGGQQGFWRLGRKQQGNGSMQSLEVGEGVAEKAIKGNKKATIVEEKEKQDTQSQRIQTLPAKDMPIPLSQAKEMKVNTPTNSLRDKDSLIKKKARKGALDSSMQPKAVKVRSRNKPSKDRVFSRLYLAQELFLGCDIDTLNNCAGQFDEQGLPLSGKVESGTEGTAKPALSRLDSVCSLASSNASSIGMPNVGTGSGLGRKKATWAMKFSLDGKYLAVAGQDTVIRIYAVLDTEEARRKVEADALPSGSLEALLPIKNYHATTSSTSLNSTGKNSTKSKSGSKVAPILPNLSVFSSEPIKEFKGHTSDILDLSWSKGDFLLSASMDKTARIWHLSRQTSLVSFVHGDFVTSAVFHPQDDRFFLSGSLDGKLRLWNISAKKVQSSQEVPGLITACAFTQSGNTACAGTFAGHALFYQTDGLIYSSSIAVRSPSGKNSKGGRKITSIEPLLSDEATSKGNSNNFKHERVLITSNDSRVRAYDLRDKSMLARFKAKTYTNRTSQIRANLSDDNTFIVAGSEATSSSEGGQVHIWDGSSEFFDSDSKRLSYKRSSNGSGRPCTTTNSPLPSDSVVEFYTAHAGTVTCAIMAPLTTNTYLKASHDYIMMQSEKRLAEESKKNSRPIGGISALGTISLSSALSAAVPSPLRIGSGNGENGQLGFHRKLNRIIITVDESAVVRVWRSDSLKTVEG
ncbi:hypothetical protein CBS101457_004603 [Exobasidium rhododendri]|nr:hypothetical protein CBS101457_004603 [Exobasidium rhododendri]